MAKSRKGKTTRFWINSTKKMIETKFKSCPKGKEKELFLMLEEWGQKELKDKQQEIFLTALYNADCTQAVQMEIALDKGLAKIRGEQEQETLEELEKPVPLIDPNSKQSWCERELNRLNKLKNHRPLTSEEEETRFYCKSTLDSERAERFYLNGGDNE